MPWNATLFQPYCHRVDRGALAPALYLRQPRCGALRRAIHNWLPRRLPATLILEAHGARP